MTSGAAGRVGVPSWVDDEQLARVAWSRLAEPPDEVAGAVVELLGASEALRRVVAGRSMLPPGASHLRLTEAVSRWRVRLRSLDPEHDLRVAEACGARAVVPSDAEWPARVGDLQLAAPVCLWVRGDASLAGVVDNSVAVVGTRSPSAYGEHMAGDLAAGVADRGVTVVSGAALGIDGVAHRGALAVGAPTVAVLAGGVDRYYPQAHAPLLQRIQAEGLLVSEQPPGASSMKHRFLARNRLIAALSRATVVVEAPWRSGAIATARRADEISRPVGAVPGQATSATSAGCHRLLREGLATCVTDAGEVMELVARIGATQTALPLVPVEDHDDLDPVTRRVLEALPVRRGSGPESLARVAGLTVRETSAALGRLELAELATRTAGPGGVAWRRAARRPAAGLPR